MKLLIAHFGAIDVATGGSETSPIAGTLYLGHRCAHPGGLSGSTASHGVLAETDGGHTHKLQHILQILLGVGITHHLARVGHVWIPGTARRHYGARPIRSQKVEILFGQTNRAQFWILGGIQAPEIMNETL